MANHGLSDLTATVALPKSEYEDLVRQSETLKIIKKTIESSSGALAIVSIRRILGIEWENKENETKIVGHTLDGDNIVIKEYPGSRFYDTTED